MIEVSGLEAKRDMWLAIILAIIMGITFTTFVYARLFYLFPGKNLFDIIEICFGKYTQKIIMFIFTIFIFEEGAELLRNVGQFIIVNSLTKTNIIIPMIFISILCILIVKGGIEVLGRWSELFLGLVIYSILIWFFMSIPKMKIDNLRPVLSNGIKPILKGGFRVFIFPFCQTFTFTMVFSGGKKRKSPYKIYFSGIIIGGIVLFLVSVSAFLVIGIDVENTYYPSYTAIKRIGIKDFLERAEVLVAVIFVITAFLKGSVYLLATCKGVAKIFELKDYRLIVTPIAALILNLAYFEFDSILDFFDFSEVWYYYVFPFLVILPIIILITAEIKKRQMKI